jgi:hypothetical protein
MINLDLLNDKGPSVSKTLMPGTHKCKINSIKLEVAPFDKEASVVLLNVESEPMGDDFEGFFIDKDNPEAGRFLGQVGRVRASEYPFKNGTTKSGIAVNKDLEILKAIQNIAKVTGTLKWMEDNNNKFETIEEYVEAYNNDAPFKDVFINMTLAAREYFKDNYPKYDLFLPRAMRPSINMESCTVAEENSKLVKFDEAVHIKRKKQENVESFGGNDIPTSSSVSSDFDL